MLKLILYTTLNIDNTAIQYKIYFDPKAKKYLFKATKDKFPFFSISKGARGWQFENLTDIFVQTQAIEDIEFVISHVQNDAIPD